MSIKDNIRKIRKERKMTQAELAAALGKGTSTIQKYELGITCPSLEMIRKMCAVLKCDFHDIVESSASAPSTPESRAAFEKKAELPLGTLDRMSAERGLQSIAEWNTSAKRAMEVPDGRLGDGQKLLNLLVSIAGFRVEFDGQQFYFVRGHAAVPVSESDLVLLLGSLENDITRRCFDLLAMLLAPGDNGKGADSASADEPSSR